MNFVKYYYEKLHQIFEKTIIILCLFKFNVINFNYNFREI